MTEQDKEAALSEAYVHTIAARVGAIVAIRNRDYGIDGSFHEVADVDGLKVENGILINYQLKASQRCIIRDTEIVYKLRAEAYNRLAAITKGSITPLILLLLHLPPDPNEWFKICEDYLQLRKCCYWLHWRETTPTTHSSSVTICIPRSQQFTPDVLKMLFEQHKRGELR